MNKADKTYIYDSEICVRAADFLETGKSDSDTIDKALEYAAGNNIKNVLIDKKNWIIDRAIEVRSNMSIIVDSVMIKLADRVLDNVFRPDSMVMKPDDKFGFPLEIRETENIRIIGKNNAVLEGPDIHRNMFHPVLKETQEALGDFWGWRAFMIFFPRCRRFEVSGFIIRKSSSWAISLERSKEGYIHNIEIYSTCKNGDGINIRSGCSRIFIENIKGSTSDDFIAINSFGTDSRIFPQENYVYPTMPSDYLIDQGESIEDRHIHDIFINNIHSATSEYSQAVALMSRQGHKLFRIWIHGVYDGNSCDDSPKRRLDMVGAYYKNYGDDSIADDDLSEIRIDTVVCNSSLTAVLFRDHVRDLWINNVIQNCPEGEVLAALDDDITLTNSSAVSGNMRLSAATWHIEPDTTGTFLIRKY